MILTRLRLAVLSAIDVAELRSLWGFKVIVGLRAAFTPGLAGREGAR